VIADTRTLDRGIVDGIVQPAERIHCFVDEAATSSARVTSVRRTRQTPPSA
jgi:hypothetical protein